MKLQGMGFERELDAIVMIPRPKNHRKGFKTEI